MHEKSICFSWPLISQWHPTFIGASGILTQNQEFVYVGVCPIPHNCVRNTYNKSRRPNFDPFSDFKCSHVIFSILSQERMTISWTQVDQHTIKCLKLINWSTYSNQAQFIKFISNSIHTRTFLMIFSHFTAFLMIQTHITHIILIKNRSTIMVTNIYIHSHLYLIISTMLIQYSIIESYINIPRLMNINITKSKTFLIQYFITR